MIEFDFIQEDDASRYLAENPSPGFDAEHAALLESQRNMRHPIYCNFCGKSSDQVICMVAGPVVFICDECVELAVAVVAMKKAETEAITIEQNLLQANEMSGSPNLTTTEGRDGEPGLRPLKEGTRCAF